MNKIRFKSNIMCNGCIAKVTPILNMLDDVETWTVDLDDEDRILTLKGEDLKGEEVIKALEDIGFEIEEVV